MAHVAQPLPAAYTLPWFEFVCVELLAKNPNEATKILLEFRASSYAFVARDFLVNTTIPLVKFQAALVLQYACILRWDSMSTADQNEFRSLIWNMIVPDSSSAPSSTSAAAALPAYAANKLMQIFVLTWKRGWRGETIEAKQGFLFSLLSIVHASQPGGSAQIAAVTTQLFEAPPQASAGVTVGEGSALQVQLRRGLGLYCFVLRLLRVLVEEFNRPSSADGIFNLAMHRAVHLAFERGGGSGSGNGETEAAGAVSVLVRSLTPQTQGHTQGGVGVGVGALPPLVPQAVVGGLHDCFAAGAGSLASCLGQFQTCFGFLGRYLFHCGSGPTATGAGVDPSSAAAALASTAPVLANPLAALELLQVCTNVKEATKLFAECLTWEAAQAQTQASTGARRGGGGGGGEANEERRTVLVPAAWREHVFSAPLVCALCGGYESMRQLFLYCHLHGDAASTHDPALRERMSALSSELGCCMLETRNLMLLYTSMGMPAELGLSQQQQVDTCGLLVQHLVVPLFGRLADPTEFFQPASGDGGMGTGPATETLLAAATRSLLSQRLAHTLAQQQVAVSAALLRSVYMQLRTDEFEYSCASVARLLYSYKIRVLAQVPAFSASVLLLLGKSAFLLSEEIACMSSRRLELQYIQQRKAHSSGDVLSATLVPELISSGSGDNSGSRQYDEELEYTPASVVESWRGDVIIRMLDLWGSILENPLLLCYPHILCPGETFGPTDSSGAPTHPDMSLKLQLKEMSGVVFRNLLKCVLLSSLAQTGDEEEEEEEEEENIVDATLASLIHSICILGRYRYASSLALVLSQLNCSMTNMTAAPDPGRASAQLVRVSEQILTITARFATHLCTTTPEALAADADDSSGLAVGTVVGQYDALLTAVASKHSELPDVSYLILDCYLREKEHVQTHAQGQSAEIIPLQQRLVGQVMALLMQHQGALLQQSPEELCVNAFMGAAVHSPQLLQHAFSFYDSYALTYFGGGAVGAGGAGAGAVLAEFYGMHWGSADIWTALEAAVQCVYLVVVTCPYEVECLRAGLEMLVNLSKSARTHAFLQQSPAVLQLTGLLNTTETNKGPLARLPAESLRLLVHSVGTTLLKTGNRALFEQVCGAVYNLVERCHGSVVNATSANVAPRAALLTEVQFATLLALGLVRCQCQVEQGQRNMLHVLLDHCATRLLAVLTEFFRHKFTMDDALMFYCLLLSEYAEYQLGTVSSTAAVNLYCTVYQFYGILDRRLRSTTLFTATTTSTSSGSGSGSSVGSAPTASALANSEALFEYELFRAALCLMNELATRDFIMDDDVPGADAGVTVLSSAAMEQVLVCTLFAGLHMCFTRASPALLQGFPQLAERYYSFVQYLSNAYDKQFLGYLGMIPSGAAAGEAGVTVHSITLSMPSNPNASTPLAFFDRVAQQLLWCLSSHSTDTVTSKVILSIIANVTNNYWNHLSRLVTRFARLESTSNQAVLAQCGHLVAHNGAINSSLFRLLEHLFAIVSLPASAHASGGSGGGGGGGGADGAIPITTSAYPEQLDSYGATIFSLLVYSHTVSTLPNYSPQLQATHSIQAFITSSSAVLAQHAPSAEAHQQLLAHFQELLTTKNVEYSNVNSRAHRGVFVGNLKAYATAVKPLLLFK